MNHPGNPYSRLPPPGGRGELAATGQFLLHLSPPLAKWGGPPPLPEGGSWAGPASTLPGLFQRGCQRQGGGPRRSRGGLLPSCEESRSPPLFAESPSPLGPLVLSSLPAPWGTSPPPKRGGERLLFRRQDWEPPFSFFPPLLPGGRGRGGRENCKGRHTRQTETSVFPPPSVQAIFPASSPLAPPPGLPRVLGGRAFAKFLRGTRPGSPGGGS